MDTLTLSNGIAVTVKRRRHLRALKIAVLPGGVVTLTLPFSLPLSRGRAFVEGKREWIAEKQELLAKHRPSLLSLGNKEEYRAHKETARAHILGRLQFFQGQYTLFPESVSIRNQKTRFGSCSARGQLSFNYQLLFLPVELCDYVIVHELCHLKELNHSSRFWELVGQTFPDYRRLRQELQRFTREVSEARS